MRLKFRKILQDSWSQSRNFGEFLEDFERIQCICFTRYMVPRMVRTRVLAHLEKQKKILLGGREKLILYAIAASMHEIPSFLSISATLLNEKFVFPERMRLTY